MKNYFINLFNTVWDSLRWAFATFRIVDVLDILVVAFLIYEVFLFVRSSRAKTLIKGIFWVIGMWLVAAFLSLNMTRWIFETTLSVGIIALVVLFTPEIRKALDDLGQTKVVSKIFTLEEKRKEDLTDDNVEAIVNAVVAMAKVKTGALICLENSINLDDWVRTGITLDSEISSQLLINIFEKNTPLHDGAVIIRNNRIASATCYLPLSNDPTISKELGTRHRAAIGLSESCDGRIIVVSEETGAISLVYQGQLFRNITGAELTNYIKAPAVDKKHKLFSFKIVKKKEKKNKQNIGSNSEAKGGNEQ